MAKTTRKSQSVTAGITSLQYEEALAKYAANDVQKCKLETEMDEEMTAIRDEYDGDINLLVAEQGMLMAIIKGYCVQNKDSLFVDKKSIDTLFGKLGFRKSPQALKLLKGNKWEDVVEKLHEYLPAYIRKVEEADKEKLLADRDKEDVVKHFPTIGVQIVQDEKFFIDLKKEEITAAA